MMKTLLAIVLALTLITTARADDALLVFAASSLTESFRELGRLHAKKHPAPSFNFAATSELRLQLEHGARADVFAAASADDMDRAVKAGLVEAPRTFATNRLVVIVPASNPGKIDTLRDLARPGLKLVTAQATVPVGKYTQAALDKLAADPSYGAAYAAAVRKNFVSFEINVKQVCAKVSLGEADGGICYSSDVTAKLGQTVHALPIPEAYNVRATYPVAVVARAPHADAARAFVDLLLSAEGQAVLGRYNFGAPE